jgi:predicted DCC family thiol-disulfide oxidoreductase YuxK
LFDGVCNLCDSSVQFIVKRDTEGYFSFASLQGKAGQNLLNIHGLNSNINSFILIEKDKVYTKSTAALRVCVHLNGPWKLLTGFRIIPLRFRDSIYNLIANNRYKWFGKKESCMLPKPEWRNRFLD